MLYTILPISSPTVTITRSLYWCISADAYSIQIGLVYNIVHSNLDIANKSVRHFLFTISNIICLVNPQNGSWVLFTILWNSLYWGLLYQGLSIITNHNFSLGTPIAAHIYLPIFFRLESPSAYSYLENRSVKRICLIKIGLICNSKYTGYYIC